MKKDPRRYDDMLHLPHHRSESHPPMTMDNRAAQFSPFAALTGYEAAVKETARQTQRKILLSDDEKTLLDARLGRLMRKLPEQPPVTVTFFVPDAKKDGGSYLNVTGKLRKIDAYERKIVLYDTDHLNRCHEIAIEDILAIDPIG